MERKEAIALVREISSIARLSLVALTEKTRGKYALMLVGDYNIDELRNLVAEKHLIAEKDVQNGICVIRKP